MAGRQLPKLRKVPVVELPMTKVGVATRHRLNCLHEQETTPPTLQPKAGAELQAELARDREVLAAQLVAQYESPSPDIVRVAIESHGFTDLLAPGLAAHLVPWIQLPTIIGEGSLCLWLLIRGVDARQWARQARAASRVPSPPVEVLA